LNTTLNSTASLSVAESPSPRISESLRGILSKNPGVTKFSVERILASIGSGHVEASLMMFSLPALVRVPCPRGVVSIPTGAIGCQIASGGKPIQVPRFILKKSVSRRALAVAIHAILPVLEAAEKVVRPRWSWVSHPTFRRAIGMFVFLLAVALAFPLLGFSSLHATSIFVMALGMAEQDGLAVLAGVAVGMLSLAVLAVSGMTAKALRAKAGRWLRKIARKLGLQLFARLLRRWGYERIARLLTLEWSELLLLWNPEKKAAPRRTSLPAPNAAGIDPKSLPEPPGSASARPAHSPRAA
jgi:hypothetical protein